MACNTQGRKVFTKRIHYKEYVSAGGGVVGVGVGVTISHDRTSQMYVRGAFARPRKLLSV